MLWCYLLSYDLTETLPQALVREPDTLDDEVVNWVPPFPGAVAVGVIAPGGGAGLPCWRCCGDEFGAGLDLSLGDGWGICQPSLPVVEGVRTRSTSTRRRSPGTASTSGPGR